MQPLRRRRSVYTFEVLTLCGDRSWGQNSIEKLCYTGSDRSDGVCDYLAALSAREIAARLIPPEYHRGDAPAPLSPACELSFHKRSGISFRGLSSHTKDRKLPLICKTWVLSSTSPMQVSDDHISFSDMDDDEGWKTYPAAVYQALAKYFWVICTFVLFFGNILSSTWPSGRGFAVQSDVNPELPPESKRSVFEAVQIDC